MACGNQIALSTDQREGLLLDRPVLGAVCARSPARLGDSTMPSPTSQQVKEPWHALDLASLWKALDSGEEGLTALEARQRLESFGPNQLPQQPALTWWQILANQLRSPLIYILAIAGLVSLAIGDVTDAGFIFGVLLLNTLIGGYQEWRAEQSTHALQKLLRIRAHQNPQNEEKRNAQDSPRRSRVPLLSRCLNMGRLRRFTMVYLGSSLRTTRRTIRTPSRRCRLPILVRQA